MIIKNGFMVSVEIIIDAGERSVKVARGNSLLWLYEEKCLPT